MELVYLWVEDYKNIKKQGFNFSPRFKCTYDEDKNELKIIDKEETGEVYSKDFFGKKINITAIVGENGSGKSSILDCIIGSIAYANEKDLILFESKKRFYCNKICKCDFEIEFLEDNIILGKNNKFFEICTHTSDFINSEFFFNRNLDLYKDINPMSISDNPIESLNEIQGLLTLNVDRVIYQVQKLSLKEILKNNSTFFSPQKYYISLNINKLNYILFDIMLYGEGEHNELKEQVKSYINKILSNKKLEYLIDFFFFINKYDRSDNQYNYLKQAVKNQEIKYNIFFPLSDEETNMKNYFLSIGRELNKENNFNNEVQKIFKEILHNDNIFSSFLNLFDINLKEKNKYFSDLSTGEKNLLLLEGLIKDTKNKNVLLLLDEIDLSYHPNWARKFINKLVHATNKNIHIINSSHSPFILSDLPKENVIFLERGKQVYPFEDGKQTFGANIHTLLSHGFFMDEKGLMGEFAKDKIQDVINFLNNEKSIIKTKEDVWKIIQIIGEPFLKYKLEEKYHENYSSDEVKNETKIKRLEQELERLKNVKPKN